MPVFALFRFAVPGWWLRRVPLTWPVAVPFLAGAGCLVTAGGPFPEFNDRTEYLPLPKFVGVDRHAHGILAATGEYAGYGFLLSVLVTQVVVVVRAVRGRRVPVAGAQPPTAVR